MGIFDDLRLKYNTGQLPIKFIFINVGLFLVVRLSDIICTLMGSPFSVAPYLELPSDPTLLLHRPYTVISYMFFQYDLLHLLFNMLWLYWFGQLFLLFFNAKQFGGVYILGGLSGAVLYLAAYNLLPYFAASRGMLLGASAAVLGVVFAVSAYAPDYKIRLFLLGDVQQLVVVLLPAEARNQRLGKEHHVELARLLVERRGLDQRPAVHDAHHTVFDIRLRHDSVDCCRIPPT